MIIAFSNQKGGVGKSTLTVHMAYYLKNQGHTVCVVDADPQGNSSRVLNEDRDGEDFYKLIIEQTTLYPLTRLTGHPFAGIALISGGYETGNAIRFLNMQAGEGRDISQRVKEKLAPYRKKFDYMLIDMPPARAGGYDIVLRAADYVIVPTQLERLSLQGVGYMAQQCQRPGMPKLLGIVPNLTRPQTIAHRAEMTELVSIFKGLVWPSLPVSTIVVEAMAAGDVVWNMPRSARVAEAFDRIGERIVANAT